MPRACGPDERYIDLTPDALEGVTPDRLRQAFLRAMTPKPTPRVDLFHVNHVKASVIDAVGELLDELPRVGRITFRELTAAFVERVEIVVRFLAMLELFKQGHVDLRQPATFGEIEIIWLGGAGVDADLALVDAYEG